MNSADLDLTQLIHRHGKRYVNRHRDLFTYIFDAQYLIHRINIEPNPALVPANVLANVVTSTAETTLYLWRRGWYSDRSLNDEMRREVLTVFSELANPDSASAEFLTPEIHSSVLIAITTA